MSKRIAIPLIFIVLMGLFYSGCSSAAAPTQEVMMESAREAPAAAPMMDQSGGMQKNLAEPQAPSANPPGDGDRIVIRNANLAIALDKPGDGMDAIAKLASDMGGFVVSSNLYKSRTSEGVELPQANITVRVPAAKLNDALTQIKSMVKDPTTDVLSESSSGEDVTREYTDIKSRLSNAEETEKQLREIMASATKTEDVLTVYNQLTQVREQIEVYKGQIQYYEQSAAFSAITVEIKSTASIQPLTVGGWKPQGVARDAVQALINALKFLANLLIWIVLFVLPIGLILVLPVWLIVRAARRRKANRKAAQQPPATPQA